MAIIAAPTSIFAETQLEPGDRCEVQPLGHADALQVPLALEPELAGKTLELPGGRDVAWTGSDGRGPVPGLQAVLVEPWDALWLEYAGQDRFRLVIDRSAQAPSLADTWTSEQGIPFAFDGGDREVWRDGAALATQLAEWDLALRAARLGTHAGFDQLMCLPMVRDMELLDHQIRTAKTVLRRFRGRALLCDEVGLGKTIEAGLVLSELHLRGLARSILILTPPSLIEQWQGELRQSAKFMKEYQNPRFAEFLKLLASIIDEGQKSGKLRSDIPAQVAARALFGALDELALWWVSGKGEKLDIHKVADWIGDLVLEGLHKK